MPRHQPTYGPVYHTRNIQHHPSVSGSAMSNHYQPIYLSSRVPHYIPQHEQESFVPAYVNHHQRSFGHNNMGSIQKHVAVSLGDDVYRGCQLINTNQFQSNQPHFTPAPLPSYRHQSTIRSSVRHLSTNEVLNQINGPARDHDNLQFQLVDEVMVLPMIPPSQIDIENMWLENEDFTDSGTPTSVGIPDETIEANLSLKVYTPSKAALSTDEETKICVVCQDEYGNMEKIGALRCGHEYHVDCIKKWLRIKNACPICKATPLSL